MQIERLSVSRLKPAPYNPRITLKPGDPAWEKLARSLDEFELVQPIVWNRRTGHVVSGHQRLEVLRQRGVTEIECVIVDLPLEKEQALNVTLNNPHVGSDWDAEKLTALVADLQELPDFDPTLTGFDAQQLRDLVLTPAFNSEQIPAATDENDSGLLRVMLEAPPADWEALQTSLNTLLQSFPNLRLHLLSNS